MTLPRYLDRKDTMNDANVLALNQLRARVRARVQELAQDRDAIFSDYHRGVEENERLHSEVRSLVEVVRILARDARNAGEARS